MALDEGRVGRPRVVHPSQLKRTSLIRERRYISLTDTRCSGKRVIKQIVSDRTVFRGENEPRLILQRTVPFYCVVERRNGVDDGRRRDGGIPFYALFRAKNATAANHR